MLARNDVRMQKNLRTRITHVIASVNFQPVYFTIKEKRAQLIFKPFSNFFLSFPRFLRFLYIIYIITENRTKKRAVFQPSALFLIPNPLHHPNLRIVRIDGKILRILRP